MNKIENHSTKENFPSYKLYTKLHFYNRQLLNSFFYKLGTGMRIRLSELYRALEPISDLSTEYAEEQERRLHPHHRED